MHRIESKSYHKMKRNQFQVYFVGKSAYFIQLQWNYYFSWLLSEANEIDYD